MHHIHMHIPQLKNYIKHLHSYSFYLLTHSVTVPLLSMCALMHTHTHTHTYMYICVYIYIHVQYMMNATILIRTNPVM